MWRFLYLQTKSAPIYYNIKCLIVNVGLGQAWVRSQFWNKTRFDYVFDLW